MTDAGRVVYSVADASVTQEERGPVVLLRFAGPCSTELLAWLPQALREVRGCAGLALGGLEGIDPAFVQVLLGAARDAVRRKRQVALVDPPAFVTEVLEQSGLGDRIPVLSCETALLEGSNLADALLREKAALADLGSRFEINPLWRRFDQEAAWICPICGAGDDGVRLTGRRPGTGTLRGARRHLLEVCPAWRSGKRAPLVAPVLDANLAEINRRKSALDTERRAKVAREMEALQGKVESLADLEQSLDAAHKKQLHLIPVDPAPDEVADIAVVYRPLQSVSGDFLDFYSLADGRFGVSIGDVSGHGIETAVIMGMAKMAFRVRAQALGTPREMMTAANADLFSELRRTAFITGFFALVDRATLRMTYVRAGHTPALVRRGDGRIEELEGSGLPFGVDDGRRFGATLEEREVQLEAGDLVLLYTDGVTEAGTADPFGDDRLRQALASAPADDARAALTSIVAALDAFLGDAPLNDDVTLICLKVRQTAKEIAPRFS